MGEYCHPRLKGGGGVGIVSMTPDKSMGRGGGGTVSPCKSMGSTVIPG